MSKIYDLFESSELIVDTAIELGASQAESVVFEEKYDTTRFNNEIHQNISNRNMGAYITVVVDSNKLSSISLSIGDITDDLLKGYIHDMIAYTKLLKGDPYFSCLPQPGKIKCDSGLYFPLTVDFQPHDKAEIINSCIKSGLDYDKRIRSVNGYFVNGKRSVKINNSNGVDEKHDISLADVQIGVSSEENGSVGKGYASKTSRDISELDLISLTMNSSENSVQSLNPKTAPPKEYEVVLKPSALATLIHSISDGFSAETYNDGRSFLCGRLGEKLFDEKIIITDDGADKRSLTATPFDGEGVPKRKLKMVQDGVTQSLCYDTYYAKREGVESTGHCPNKIDRMDGSIFKSPIPMNMILEPGDVSDESLIKDVKEGLLVTRMHYVTVIDEKKAILSGMTRDGTWLIENGEIKYPVKDLRFMDSMLKVLSSVDAIGNESTVENRLREHCGLLSSLTTPSIKLPSMRFTGLTQ